MVGDRSGRNIKARNIVFWCILFAIFIIAALFYLYAKSTLVGWILLLVLVVLVILLRKLFIKLNVVVNVILWILVLALSLLIGAFTIQIYTTGSEAAERFAVITRV